MYPTQHLSKAVKGRSIEKDTPPVLPYSREKGRADGVRIKEQPDRGCRPDRWAVSGLGKEYSL